MNLNSFYIKTPYRGWLRRGVKRWMVALLLFITLIAWGQVLAAELGWTDPNPPGTFKEFRVYRVAQPPQLLGTTLTNGFGPLVLPVGTNSVYVVGIPVDTNSISVASTNKSIFVFMAVTDLIVR